MKYKDGDFIELHWEDSVEAFYIRGHIPFEEAKDILFKHVGEDDYKLAEPIHKYARWSCTAYSECNHCLMEYDEPGRGRFKITMFKREWE